MPPEAPIDLEPAELAAARAAGEAITLVDCREPWEWELARIDGALPIPLRELPDRADELPRDGRVVVYCHHGIRSRQGAALLRAAGVAEARSLRGGIDLWSTTYDPTIPRY